MACADNRVLPPRAGVVALRAERGTVARRRDSARRDEARPLVAVRALAVVVLRTVRVAEALAGRRRLAVCDLFCINLLVYNSYER